MIKWRKKDNSFFTDGFQFIYVEGRKELEKSPLEHHTNNCCRKDRLSNTKFSRRNLRGNRKLA